MGEFTRVKSVKPSVISATCRLLFHQVLSFNILSLMGMVDRDNIRSYQLHSPLICKPGVNELFKVDQPADTHDIVHIFLNYIEIVHHRV